MKCRSGDLAVIISNRFGGNVGTFVTVKKVAIVDGELGAFWSFEKASKPLFLGGYGANRFDYITATETTEENNALLRDADLHPIRSYGLEKKDVQRLTGVLQTLREGKYDNDGLF